MARNMTKEHSIHDLKLCMTNEGALYPKLRELSRQHLESGKEISPAFQELRRQVAVYGAEYNRRFDDARIQYGPGISKEVAKNIVEHYREQIEQSR